MQLEEAKEKCVCVCVCARVQIKVVHNSLRREYISNTHLMMRLYIYIIV